MATFGVVGGALLGGYAPYARVQASSAVTVTAHTSAHTKGSWTEIIASSSGAATLAVVTVAGVGATGTDTATLLDLAIGGAGSETAVVSNIPVGGAQWTNGARWSIPLPLAIPSGSRISARIQSVVTDGKTASVTIGLLSGGGITPPSSLTVIGADAATSRGVEVGTSWTQITAATAAAYRYLIPVPSLSSASTTNSSDALDFGSGAASSEVTIGTVGVTTTTAEYIYAPAGAASWETYLVMPGRPAGTRLAARRANPCDVAVIGVP